MSTSWLRVRHKLLHHCTHVELRIQQWLQYCIYERSNFNQFLVFMVSAFWHGFYPGYYIGFSLASFMTHVGRLAYKKVWPRVEGTAYQSVFKMAMMMLCAYTNSWMLIAHMSYTVSRTMQIWRNFDFVHPVLLVVLCVLFTDDAHAQEEGGLLCLLQTRKCEIDFSVLFDTSFDPVEVF